MRIKFSKHDPRAGDIVEMDATQAQALIDAGQATKVSGDDHAEKAISAAPQNKAIEAAPSNRAITGASFQKPADRPVTQAVAKKKGK